MSTDLPFHSAVLGLRLVYDKLSAFVQEALDQEVRDVTFCWSGDRMHFDATLTWDGEKYVELAKRGVHTYNRRVSGDIDQDVIRDILRFDEGALNNMNALQALDTALAELSLGASPGQGMGNKGLSFELLTFRIDGPLQKLYDNWGNRREVIEAAVHHYQARMAIGRQELDPVDENASEYWGDEQ